MKKLSKINFNTRPAVSQVRIFRAGRFSFNSEKMGGVLALFGGTLSISVFQHAISLFCSGEGDVQQFVEGFECCAFFFGPLPRFLFRRACIQFFC
jgi:hypothetical protein